MTHLTRSEQEKVQLAQEVILYLNEILALDPNAVLNLCEHRVVVNDQLAGHPTTQIAVIEDVGYGSEDLPQGVLGLGILGILNGLVGVREDHWGYITAVYGEDQKLLHFQLTKREGEGDAPEETHPDVGEHPVTGIDAEMLINGHRRDFVNSVQHYLNELLEDDSPQHVIGHIESECRDYSKLIRDALKIYGYGKASSAAPPSELDKLVAKAGPDFKLAIDPEKIAQIQSEVTDEIARLALDGGADVANKSLLAAWAEGYEAAMNDRDAPNWAETPETPNPYVGA